MIEVRDSARSPITARSSPTQVTGREELVRDLDRPPRRTSGRPRCSARGATARPACCARCVADLAGVGPETVWIDLYELSSVADLAGAIDQGLASVQGRMRRAIDSFAGALSLRLGFVGVELSKGRRDRPDPVLTVRSLLEVLVRTAEKHPMIVVFDEFSGIANVNAAAPAMLRTQLQHHYRDSGNRLRRFAAVDDADAVHRPRPAVLRPGRPRRDRPTGDRRGHRHRPGRLRGNRSSTGGMTSALSFGPPRAIRSERCSSPTRCGASPPKAAAADEASWVDAIAGRAGQRRRRHWSGSSPCSPSVTRRRCGPSPPTAGCTDGPRRSSSCRPERRQPRSTA